MGDMQFNDTRYRVLVADPAWQFGDKLPGETRGAESNYSVMSVEDIARMPLPRLEDDAWLFLWRVHTHQEEARFVMRAWGFRYASELVWVKRTKNDLVSFGMGRTLRMGHEVCLIGKRGRPKLESRSIRSVFDAQVREHSRKPDEFFGIVESLSTGPYAEMFARQTRPGWDTYGNELTKFDPSPIPPECADESPMPNRRRRKPASLATPGA